MTRDSLPSELQTTYERRFAAVRDYRQRVWKVLIKEFFQKFVRRDGTVLDIGCGWGEFINNISAKQRFAMDLNPSSPQHLDAGVVFLHQDCSQTWSLGDHSLDTVFTSNFLEHLPHKEAVRATLSEAYRCIKPGGRVICLGPNVKYVPGAYWDFWDHYVPLTELAMKEVLELVGFRVEVCAGRFLPYTMASGIHWPTALVSVYLKVPLLWRFAGKQFLLVAVKP